MDRAELQTGVVLELVQQTRKDNVVAPIVAAGSPTHQSSRRFCGLASDTFQQVAVGVTCQRARGVPELQGRRAVPQAVQTPPRKPGGRWPVLQVSSDVLGTTAAPSSRVHTRSAVGAGVAL